MSGKRLTLRPVAGAPIPPDRARRMRIAATGMLGAMAALFVLSGQYLDLHPAWGFVHSFAEAAMVGGIADWFAVTALFRHPFGIPIPHTAIIPNNKDRIADTMADFLRDNFLTPAVVARRMIGMNIAGAVGDFLASPPKSDGSRIAAGAASLFADVLESLDPERMGGQVRSGLKATLARIEVAPPAGKMIEAAIADGRHRPLIDSVIRWVALALEDNEDLVRDMIHRRANALLRWTGLDERLANSVIDGLYKLLAETLVDPDHPIRSKVEESLEKLAHDLQHDPELKAKVEKAKNDLLDNPALADWWQGVWERARKAMLDTARNPDKAMQGEIGKLVGELGGAMSNDPRLQIMVNRFARRTAVGVATRYGDQIVRLVSETVRRWDARTITDRVEGAVGRDLQFIRINGTLVGGLVGVTLHALSYAF
ncbi:membrane protein [Blastomonas marina]|uniref:Membrane protein n=2 Tax=Blastomonas marina TaxID=1867408 RepID=A0ABQ1FI01_9SPHN|nr:membrane protein [Blastomonas marina]